MPAENRVQQPGRLGAEFRSRSMQMSPRRSPGLKEREKYQVEGPELPHKPRRPKRVKDAAEDSASKTAASGGAISPTGDSSPATGKLFSMLAFKSPTNTAGKPPTIAFKSVFQSSSSAQAAGAVGASEASSSSSASPPVGSGPGSVPGVCPSPNPPDLSLIHI